MKVDAYKCDSCEDFANEFQRDNDWIQIQMSGKTYDLCSIVCARNWFENDAWRYP